MKAPVSFSQNLKTRAKKPSYALAIIFYVLAVVVAAALAAVVLDYVNLEDYELPTLPDPITYEIALAAVAGLFLVIAVIANIAIAKKRKKFKATLNLTFGIRNAAGMKKKGKSFLKSMKKKKNRENVYKKVGFFSIAKIPALCLAFVAFSFLKVGRAYKSVFKRIF